MDKPQKTLTGCLISAPCVGERANIYSGDKVYFTSLVVAVHEISKNRAVIETMNTIYTVETESADSDVCLFPIKKQKRGLFGFFVKLRNRKKTEHK